MARPTARRARRADPESNDSSANLLTRIHEVARQVPRGQVATYGQIALVAGAPSARLVGHAMATLPNGSKVPWQRILNSQGRISPRKEGSDGDWEQRRRLETEGVRFDNKGRVDFAAVAWPGPSLHWLEKNGFDVEEIAMRSQQKRRKGAWCRWRF